MNHPTPAAAPPDEPQPAPRGLARRAVRGGATLIAARLAMQGVLWAVTLVVARLLEPRDYGLLATGMIFLAFADLLAEAGFGRALVQKAAVERADLDSVLTLSLTLAAALYAGLWLVAPLAADFLNMPALSEFLRVLALLVFTMPFRTVAMAMLDRELKMGRQAAVHVVVALAQSGTVLGLAMAGWGYWALAAGALVSRVVEALLLAVAAGWRPGLTIPTRERFGLVRFGMNVSGASLLWLIYSKSDAAVIAKVLGDEPLGFYALAFQLISMPVEKLTANTNHIAYPVYCRLQHDPERLGDWYLRLTVLLGFLGVPALAGLALVAPDAIPLLLGQQWTPAVEPFQMLSVAGVVMLYATSLPPLLNALGQPHLNFRYAATCTLVMPLGFYLGGKYGGLPGVCLCWMLLYPLVVVGFFFLTSSVSGVSPIKLAKAQLPIAAGVGIMTAVVLLVRGVVADFGPAVRLTAAVGAGVVSYAGFMLVFARGTALADLQALLRELRGSRPDGG